METLVIQNTGWNKLIRWSTVDVRGAHAIDNMGHVYDRAGNLLWTNASAPSAPSAPVNTLTTASRTKAGISLMSPNRKWVLRVNVVPAILYFNPMSSSIVDDMTNDKSVRLPLTDTFENDYCSLVADDRCECFRTNACLEAIGLDPASMTRDTRDKMRQYCPCINTTCVRLRSEYDVGDNYWVDSTRVVGSIGPAECPSQTVICSTVMGLQDATLYGSTSVVQQCGAPPPPTAPEPVRPPTTPTGTQPAPPTSTGTGTQPARPTPPQPASSGPNITAIIAVVAIALLMVILLL